jgi:27-O-demethylrifamycin SV methyltransferase
VKTAQAPVRRDVAAAYEYLEPLVSAYWGPDLHYGYWSGPEDDTPTPAATARLTSIVVERLHAAAGCRVLDLGCGNGRPAAVVARATGAEVVGIDINERALRAANEHARAEGVSDLVSFRRCDAMELPFQDNFFDAVLAFESTPHFDISRLFCELARVVRPGGRIVLETPFLRTPMTADLRRRVADFFDILQITSLDTFDAHLRGIRDAGFELVEYLDITDRVNSSFARLANTLDRHSEQLAAEYGRADAERSVRIFAGWAKVTEVGAMILVARKPNAFPADTSTGGNGR